MALISYCRLKQFTSKLNNVDKSNLKSRLPYNCEISFRVSLQNKDWSNLTSSLWVSLNCSFTFLGIIVHPSIIASSICARLRIFGKRYIILCPVCWSLWDIYLCYTFVSNSLVSFKKYMWNFDGYFGNHRFYNFFINYYFRNFRCIYLLVLRHNKKDKDDKQ